MISRHLETWEARSHIKHLIIAKHTGKYSVVDPDTLLNSVCQIKEHSRVLHFLRSSHNHGSARWLTVLANLSSSGRVSLYMTARKNKRVQTSSSWSIPTRCGQWLQELAVISVRYTDSVEKSAVQWWIHHFLFHTLGITWMARMMLKAPDNLPQSTGLGRVLNEFWIL